MPSEKQINEVLARLASEIPGYVAASLVDLDSGMTLGMKSLRGDFDLSAASAYNSEMVKQKQKIVRALNLNAAIEDMIITLTDQIHVIKMVGAGATFVYLCVDRALCNLGIARLALNKHATALV